MILLYRYKNILVITCSLSLKAKVFMMLHSLNKMQDTFMKLVMISNIKHIIKDKTDLLQPKTIQTLSLYLKIIIIYFNIFGLVVLDSLFSIEEVCRKCYKPFVNTFLNWNIHWNCAFTQCLPSNCMANC